MQGEWQGMNQESSNRLIVEFSLEPVKNEAKSEEAGRPIFDEVEWIRIRVPGEKDNNVSRQVRPGDKERFAQAYAAFQNKKEQPVEGTLLEMLPFLTKAEVLEYNGVGIRTAEQFVNMADTLGQKFMGFQATKKRMNDFLEAAKGTAVSQKMSVELQKRDEEIALLKKMIEEQTQQIKAVRRQQ